MPLTMTNPSPRARAIRSLRDWIDDGSLPQGTPLPTERVLCKRLEVGRETLRRALRVLESEGVINVAGPRTRMVATPASGESAAGPSGVMRRTVVVTSSLRRPLPAHHRGGWSDHIPYGVFETLQGKGLHGMQLTPDRMSDSDFTELLAGRPMGLVLPGLVQRPFATSELLQRARAAGVPTVVYGDGPDLADYDRVISDHESGAYELTKWLIEHGRKRPVYVGHFDRSLYWVKDRLAGYERAMREAGLTPLPAVEVVEFPDLPDASARFEAMRRLLAGYLAPLLAVDEPIDAILGVSDGISLYAAAACRVLGKVPNRDVAIAGYDNYWSEMIERQFDDTVPLVTVDKRNFELGVELVNLLMERVEGQLPPEPQLRRLPPRLVET